MILEPVSNSKHDTERPRRCESPRSPTIFTILDCPIPKVSAMSGESDSYLWSSSLVLCKNCPIVFRIMFFSSGYRWVIPQSLSGLSSQSMMKLLYRSLEFFPVNSPLILARFNSRTSGLAIVLNSLWSNVSNSDSSTLDISRDESKRCSSETKQSRWRSKIGCKASFRGRFPPSSGVYGFLAIIFLSYGQVLLEMDFRGFKMVAMYSRRLSRPIKGYLGNSMTSSRLLVLTAISFPLTSRIRTLRVWTTIGSATCKSLCSLTLWDSKRLRFSHKYHSIIFLWDFRGRLFRTTSGLPRRGLLLRVTSVDLSCVSLGANLTALTMLSRNRRSPVRFPDFIVLDRNPTYTSCATIQTRAINWFPKLFSMRCIA